MDNGSNIEKAQNSSGRISIIVEMDSSVIQSLEQYFESPFGDTGAAYLDLFLENISHEIDNLLDSQDGVLNKLNILEDTRGQLLLFIDILVLSYSLKVFSLLKKDFSFAVNSLKTRVDAEVFNKRRNQLYLSKETKSSPKRTPANKLRLTAHEVAYLFLLLNRKNVFIEHDTIALMRVMEMLTGYSHNNTRNVTNENVVLKQKNRNSILSLLSDLIKEVENDKDFEDT